jgi:tetratricopeptide (TPR) repeat protein
MMDPALAARLRDSIREDIAERFGRLCVARGLLTEEELRRAGAMKDARVLEALDEVLRAPAVRRLGRYEVGEEIGRGGIGTVFRAWDTTLRRVVALKTIRSDAGVPAALLAREAQALAGLRHPNVVTVHDAGETDGVAWIAMELVEGRAGLPSVEALRKAAEGVAAAHARGIVHRDLKPGNILVDAAGEPRVIDFGLARLADPKALSGSPAGTPYYMSPEQIADPKSVGPASDVYALGVCLYELLAGRRPYEEGETYEIFQRILRGDPEPPGPPGDLRIVCLKAMDRDPARRYPDAGAFAADLGRCLRGEPVEARPLAPLARLGRRLARRRTAIAAAAFLVLAGLWALRSERALRFRDRLKPVEALIAETRPFFYIREADVAGRLRRVEAALEELAGSHDGSSAAWKALGAGWHFAGEPARAEESLRKAAPDGEVQLLLGRILLDRAIREHFVIDGRSAAARAEASKRLGTEALVHFRQASARSALETQLASAFQSLAEGDRAAARSKCLEGLARFGPELGVEEFSCLLGAMAAGEESLSHLDRALERRPHYPWALLLRGDVRLLAGDPEGAIADFDRLLALHPRSAAAWSDRGTARLRQERWDEALADFEQALRLAPESSFTLHNRGLARLGKGDLEGARADCDRSIAKGPAIPAFFVNRGVVLQRLKDLEGAARDYDRAIELDASHVAAWVNRGLLRASRRDWRRAAEDQTRALGLEPHHALARTSRGIAFLELGERDPAFDDFDRVVSTDPRHALARYYRGTIHVERGDLDRGLRDFDEAVRLDPSHTPSRVSRAVVHESRGDCDRAIEDCTEALRIDPGCVDAWFNRGAARLQKGRAREAASDLERALKLAPPGWNSRALAERFLAAARKRLEE